MLTKAEARLLHALKTRAGREKHGAFVLEGVRVVEEALAAGVDLKFAVVSATTEDSKRSRALVEMLSANTTVHHVSAGVLREVADTETPQGVVAVAQIPSVALTRTKLPATARVLVLDAVQDPGNLGTLIRSADAFALACVIALPGTVDYWNPKVVRAAAGASFHLPLISATDDEVWQWLEQNRVTICGADMHGDAIDDALMRERVALVVGNEGGGLRKETRTHVQRFFAIVMAGRAESLNVAVAAGILLHELTRTK
jgi:TrmH family RNA methyltransferase